MERLNEIMQRTALRRQQEQGQRPEQQGNGTMPQTGQRPQQPLSRRAPRPEATTRPQRGQQYASSNSSNQSQPLNRPALPGRTRNGQADGNASPYPPSQRAPQQQHGYAPMARRGEATNHAAFQPQPQPRLLPQQRYTVEPQPSNPSRGDYYDVYPAMPPADVQDEWEEDAVSMRYGDWESEEPEVQGDARPRVGTTLVVARYPRRDGEPLATRELPIVTASDLENRSSITRTLRSVHAPQAPYEPAPQIQPPIPQPPAREASRSHRMTQPLDLRAIVGMTQDFPPETARHRIQQPVLRQVALPKQSIPTTPSSICPLCKGAGYLRADVTYGHPNFGKPIACECKEAERAEKRRMQLRSMSNLDAFREQNFRTFNSRVPGVQEAFQVAQAFANNPTGWLLLVGRNGCGKTHLAAAIANQHLAQGSLVLFATVPDLLDHLRATFAPGSTVVYDQLFSSMREAELLVLDDLGSEQNSPWASEKLFQLLNYRYNSRFPTVITTNNLRLQAVDERIRSRLMDRSLVSEVIMERAHDYRPQNPRRE